MLNKRHIPGKCSSKNLIDEQFEIVNKKQSNGNVSKKNKT